MSGGSHYCSGIEVPAQLWICVNVYWKWGLPNTTVQATLNPVLEKKEFTVSKSRGGGHNMR